MMPFGPMVRTATVREATPRNGVRLVSSVRLMRCSPVAVATVARGQHGVESEARQ